MHVFSHANLFFLLLYDQISATFCINHHSICTVTVMRLILSMILRLYSTTLYLRFGTCYLHQEVNHYSYYSMCTLPHFFLKENELNWYIAVCTYMTLAVWRPSLLLHDLYCTIGSKTKSPLGPLMSTCLSPV